MSKLTWKPVLGTQTYCSTACGAGCTRADYKKARDAGLRLAVRLGKGWVPHVWENMGWNYKAIHKSLSMSVYDNGNKKYWADVRLGGLQFHSDGRTPRQALSNALAKADAVVADRFAVRSKVGL